MGQDKSSSTSDNAALKAATDAFARHEIPAWITEHVERYRKDPANGHWWDSRSLGGSERTPTLLLTTKGRKSGRILTSPLIYGEDAGRYIVIGSKGGAPEHPAWYLNLVNEPVVEVQVYDKIFNARASVAVGAERKRLFEMMTKVYAPYPSYQKRTDRELPVVVLQPI